MLQSMSISVLTNQVELKSKYSMVSTGTERLVACGKVPVEMQQHMKVPYMEGTFGLPIKYGYSVVAEKNDGTLVHTMHPHQEMMSLEAEALFPLPKELPANRAALISNMETVINAIWDGNPQSHQKVAICGFGNIGSLLANTLRIHLDIEVSILEKNEWRLQKALDLGWQKAREEEKFDIIFHCSSTSDGLNHCLSKLSLEGKLIELSWYGNQKVEVELGKDFHYNRLQIISSQVSQIPKRKSNEYDYAKRKQLAADWLLHESYDRLIGSIIPFAETPRFFDQLRNGTQEDSLIYLIKY